jgi:hypothetical protein
MSEWLMSPWAKYNVAMFVIAIAGLVSIWRWRRARDREQLDQRTRFFQGRDLT